MDSYLEIKVEQSRTDLPESDVLKKYLGTNIKETSKLQEVAMIQATRELADLLLKEGGAVAVKKHTQELIVTSIEGTPLPECEYNIIKDNYRAAIDILRMEYHKILGKNTNICLTYALEDTNICLTYLLEEKAKPKELGNEQLPLGKVTVYEKTQNL